MGKQPNFPMVKQWEHVAITVYWCLLKQDFMAALSGNMMMKHSILGGTPVSHSLAKS